MKVGERGQVTIPREIRQRFGIDSQTKVEFAVGRGTIVLRKQSKKLNLAKQRGVCKDRLKELGYSSVDDYMESVRGR
jgi:AbrB family looped-hinge helix DNA binding protein